MAVFVSPGAYVREIDLSLYVPAIGQTIFGVVGGAVKGPFNKATFVSGQADFVRKFGPPTDDVGFGPYGMLQFLRRGTRGWYVRVGDGTEAPSTLDILGAATPATAVSLPNVWDPVVTGVNDILEITTVVSGYTSDTETITLSAGSQTAAQIANDIADSGKLPELNLEMFVTPQLEIVLRGNAYARAVTSGATVTVDAGPAVTPVVVSIDGGTNVTVDPTKEYNSSTEPTGVVGAVGAGAIAVATMATKLNSNPSFSNVASAFVVGNKLAIRTLTQGSEGTVEIKGATHANWGFTEDTVFDVDAVSSSDEITFTINSTWPFFDPDGDAANYPNTHTGTDGGTTTLSLEAKTPGTWGNNLKIKIRPGNALGTFALEVYERKTGSEMYFLVETWDGLVFTPTTSPDYFVTRINDEVTGSGYISITDAGTAEMPDGFDTIGGVFYGPMEGGLDGFDTIDAGAYIGTNPAPTGLQIFRSGELIDVNLLAVPGVSEPAVINAMIEICETRGDAMCLVDPPLGLDVQTVVDWHNGAGAYASSHAAFNSSYAALYWPWIEIFDSYNNQKLLTPPSGHIAAVYAYNDYQRELWFAPAGLQRGFIPAAVRLETQSPSQGERDLLYGFPNNINPIVSFTGQGIVVWGQKTLWRQPTAVDRVNVRRLLLYARKIIASTVRFLVFEPNDRTTWRAFINLVTPWLRNIQKKRGLLEFKVVCDEGTNPPDQVDQGIMNGQIFLRPTKAAEIIVVDFVLTSTGAKFEEAIY